MTEDFTPISTQNFSYKIDVEKDKVYSWCACGLSKNQPFCDGSHVSTNIRPVIYKAAESKRVGFCGCRKTKSSPLCDGSHRDDK